MFKYFESIDLMVDAELKHSNKKHGNRHNSLHESYAVILEEYDEALDDMVLTSKHINKLWKAVKRDDCHKAVSRIKDVELGAVCALLELVQVIAMCRKAVVSVDGGG